MIKFILSVCTLCILLTNSYSQSPTPFACLGSDGFGYYSSSATSSLSGAILTYSSSRISKITTSTGNRVTLCDATTIGIALNGLAFNPHDNFLYAASRYDATQFSGKLYRIGENCQKLEIPVTGAIVKFNTNNINTIDAEGGNISSATFDLDNHYYVNTSFTNTSSTGFRNKLQTIKIVSNTALVQSTVTLTCPSCITNKLRVTDIIFDEGSGLLLGSNKETDKLYSINTSTGVLLEIGTTGITSSIVGIYKNRDGNVRAIAQNGNIYSVNASTGAFSFLSTTNTLNSGNADAASGCYAPPNISGNLYIDANGLIDYTVNGIDTNMAGTTIMYANLILDGLVLKTDVLSSDGYYQFLGLFSGNYEVQISSNQGMVGQAAPTQDLPTTYEWTGDNTGVTAGDDGTPDGKQSVTISMGLDMVEVNFGINGIPITNGLTTPSQENPNGTVQVNVPPLTFSDPEDVGINNITIQSIPNPTTQGTLYYNSIDVTLGQYISNYDASLLTVDPIDGNVTVSFMFFSTDQAGAMSNTSTVNIPFIFTTLPVEWVYFRGHNTGSENILEWSTASEINSDHFTIERQNAFGYFEAIDKVSSEGNSSHVKDYSFIDNNILPVTYYRLVQVDIDGKTDTSPIIAINSRAQKFINLYPALASDYINVDIEIQDDNKTQYQILNITGQVMQQGLLESKTNQIEISLLEHGIYFFKILITGDVHKTLRFVKS